MLPKNIKQYECSMTGKLVLEGIKSHSHQVPLTIRRVEGKDGEGILHRHSVLQVGYLHFSS